MELGYSREIYLKTLRKIILQKPAFVDKVINKGKSPQMFSSSCKLLKMDAYANDFQKIFLAKILVIATRSDQIRQQLLQKLWSIFIFNKSKIYWKEILNRPPYFYFQKDIKVSTSKFCRFSIHQNHMHRVHRNDVQFSAIKFTLKKLHRKGVNFLSIKLRRTKHVETMPNIVLSQLHRKDPSNRRGNS